MLCITNNSIKHQSFVYTQLNDQTVLFQTIAFGIVNEVKWFQVLLCITNNSIKHQSFVYTQLNDQTALFQTIQFNISHSFALSLDVKQFYLIHRLDPIRCHHSRPEWTWEQWQWKGKAHSSNLQHYWSLIIRLFSVLSRTLIEGVLLLCREVVGVFHSPCCLSWDKYLDLPEKWKNCGTWKWQWYQLKLDPLGILDSIKEVEMKEKITKEYLGWMRKILETKLYSRNLIKVINTWTVLLVRYLGLFLKCMRDELKQIDKKANDNAQGLTSEK